MKKSDIIIFASILIAIIISIITYSQMPEKIAIHWDTQGDINGQMSKLWGLFLMPILLIGLTILFRFIPKIDPLKENIELIRKHYDRFIIIITLFILFIHIHIILWNLGLKINPNMILPIGVGILFYHMGLLWEKAKKNWFIGIRTPWTMTSDTVWDKTNKLAGKLFKIAGYIAISAILLPNYAIFFIAIPILLITPYTVYYSYKEYQKEMMQKENEERKKPRFRV